jgi:hypothetical protein
MRVYYGRALDRLAGTGGDDSRNFEGCGASSLKSQSFLRRQVGKKASTLAIRTLFGGTYSRNSGLPTNLRKGATVIFLAGSAGSPLLHKGQQFSEFRFLCVHVWSSAPFGAAVAQTRSSGELFARTQAAGYVTTISSLVRHAIPA